MEIRASVTAILGNTPSLCLVSYLDLEILRIAEKKKKKKRSGLSNSRKNVLYAYIIYERLVNFGFFTCLFGYLYTWIQVSIAALIMAMVNLSALLRCYEVSNNSQRCHKTNGLIIEHQKTSWKGLALLKLESVVW